MILYVNGDSHTAAAEAVNPYAFAEDDPALVYLGRLPHPNNLSASWGKTLADNIKATFKCDAESAASNDRIIRTTREWLSKLQTPKKEVLMIIQWSTWERQEWLIDNVWYQINASGIDDVPSSHQQQYKEFVSSVDWDGCTRESHEKIWAFHQELDGLGIRHVFFNGNSHFGKIAKDAQKDWAHSYIGPYDPKMTYNQWLLDHGHDTVSPKSYHFGREAHAAWARFVLQYIIQHKMV
jgi:hypothetical protein